MERHLQVEINELKQSLLKMAGLVESSINKAIRSITERDAGLAQEVIEEDAKIDQLEIRIENQCLRILARHQPVAVDLRFLITAVKMDNDLERLGDHAVNIAQNAERLIETPPLKPLIDLPRMARLAEGMVKDSLDAFVERDVRKARAVCQRDDQVDQLEYQISRELVSYMVEDPRNITRALDLMIIAKNLERIADLSTNIAEEVIFMVEARTIKHHFDKADEEES